MLSDITCIHKKKSFKNQPLIVQKFVSCFTGPCLREYHSGQYRRFTFYFVEQENRVAKLLTIPDATQPGSRFDLRIEYCGKRIKEKAHEWIEANDAPVYVRDCLYRSEKAVDTQICCDALQLAADGKLDRLFLYANDYDYVPLCQKLRQLGVNINLFRLESKRVNKDFVEEFDAFDVLDDCFLRDCFGLKKDTK